MKNQIEKEVKQIENKIQKEVKKAKRKIEKLKTKIFLTEVRGGENVSFFVNLYSKEVRSLNIAVKMLNEELLLHYQRTNKI